MPPADQEFAGHARHAVPPGEYVPAAHAIVHAAALVPLPSGLLVPAAHDWHDVEAPSAKYWPAEQHTAVPDGVQRLVVPAAQAGDAVQAETTAS